MGEGELKKRLIEAGTTNRISLETKLMMAQFLCLLSEAHKEFPFVDFAKPKQYAYEVNNQIKAILDWKLKWFGDAPEPSVSQFTS